MLFNSLEFYLFFIATFFVWLLFPAEKRWSVLLMAGYIFYSLWQPWFVLVLIWCTLISWTAGLVIAGAENKRQKKIYLSVVVILNLLPLFFFKYYNFFNETIRDLFSVAGWRYHGSTLDVLLPVGISFFTFQAVSYCADVYLKKIEAESRIGIFALYLSFFPKLVSGPIERGGNLLHQFRQASRFNMTLFSAGVGLFLWGVFKKMVIADRLGMYVNMVFKDPGSFYGTTAIFASWMYSLQIYCDFSAYMDMAIGCGWMFGIELSRNFNFPYMARSIADFWRRWHITLTSWFRDYIYVPLGGNRVHAGYWACNIMLVFLLSGLWHGAAWTFIFWGGLHGFFYLAGMATSPVRERIKHFLGINGKLEAVLQVAITFNLVSLAWVFFRAGNIKNAFALIWNMGTHLNLPVRMMASEFSTILAFSAAVFFIGMELLLYWADQKSIKLLQVIPSYIRYPAYACGLLAITLLGVSSNEFIYFQF
jgi:alginate O-acetyltransferase complex protein AlgI